MSAQRSEDLFVHKIETTHHRAENLFQAVQESTWAQPQLVFDCLEELRVALEELHVAEEELYQRNEDLIQARQAAEAERQRYQELFEFAPDGYLVTDVYGTVQEANHAAAQLLNIAQKHLIGKPLISAVPEPYRRPFRWMLSHLLTTHRLQEWEVQLNRRDREPFDAALTVETVRDSNQVVALRWLLRDVTARKQAEKQLRQVELQNLQLIEADRAKNQFIATVSHELRTPMNAILGFSELLLRQFHRHQHWQYGGMIERILRNGRQLLQMIEQMLDFSQLQTSCLTLQVETFDLAELAVETIATLQSLTNQKALTLQTYLTQPSILVTIDRNRVRQILMNLLSNAIKFTETGCITLEIWDLPESRIAIVVKDSGIGIAPEDQSRIFQDFWQVDQSSTRRYGGTGLGLAIAHALVRLMHGTISVESQLGEGSTFRVELPRCLPAP